MSTWSWVSREHLGLTMIPETLKTLLEAQLEAAMQRYLLANSASWGIVPPFIFHQMRGSSSALSSGILLYTRNSPFNFSCVESPAWDDVPSSLPFFSPWMAESRCFKSVFDFLDSLLWLEASAPVAMGVSDVPAPSSAFPTCSRRLCFTSSSRATKLALNLGSR